MDEKPSKRRRASVRITLVLIGAAGLAACGSSNEPQMRRDTYASLADCKADWHREELCEQAPASSTSSGSHGSGSHYYGPVYRSSSTSSSPPSGSRAISSSTVSRGGFGASSSFHGSSSS